MKEAIGQLLPLGVVVAISPFPIVAIVLMLATPRARTNGLAFLLGWLGGLAVAGAVILLVSNGADASDKGEPATWVSVLQLILGVLLLTVGVRQFRGRPHEGETAELPKWMAAINSFGPAKSLGMGLLLSGLNPKNLLLTVAAAAAIAETGIADGQEAIALAVFIAIATLGVGIPVVIYFALGERSRKLLDGVRSWMAANNAVIMAVLMLVIGVKLIGDGIGSL
jgi:threonine/homoserine/homoserine lactone efflux protein